ncbi:CHASE domain-containing protein [Oharaeibacter diazotrophicus]|uniref:CHASE domain-containing protein n=1 Tax=Oharaeibacter diazotrophicus TaxID=1920512 RepID=UPI000F84CDDB|nr:CHASE domain-containing protein [Oharaeibacter diazotrophicus]
MTTPTAHEGGDARRRRRAPVATYLVALAVLALSVYMADAIRGADDVRRTALLGQAASRLESRIREHVNLLRAAAGFFDAAGGKVDRDALRRFLGAVDVEHRIPGIQGVGFAMAVPAADPAAATARLAANYGRHVEPWPATDQEMRFPIVLLEPQDGRNAAALGFDMWSEPVRRKAMAEAWSANEARASGPVHLVQEIDARRQTGFLIYVPVFARPAAGVAGRGPILGFVYAPFRAGDLMRRAQDRVSPIALLMRLRDGRTGGVMFANAPDEAFRGAYVRSIDVAGRALHLSLAVAPGGASEAFDPAAVVLAMGFGLAALVLWSGRAQARELAAAAALSETERRAAAEKDLVLQEMRHRLKNAIGRIQSIARLTGRAAPDLPAFLDAFGGRLQAMAAAQDLLVASHRDHTSLAELVGSELGQVGAAAGERVETSGPDVDLDDDRAYAVGLVLHELATNALKYGALSGDGHLAVTWTAEGGRIRLVWSERDIVLPETPIRAGFGTRLIDALVTGQLSGTWTRTAEDGRLVVEIDFRATAGAA